MILKRIAQLNCAGESQAQCATWQIVCTGSMWRPVPMLTFANRRGVAGKGDLWKSF
jgi:hypothetical protein